MKSSVGQMTAEKEQSAMAEGKMRADSGQAAGRRAGTLLSKKKERGQKEEREV